MGLLSWLFGEGGALGYWPEDRSAYAPVVLGVRTIDGKRITRIQRNTHPLYEEKGWRKVGDALRGRYRMRHWSYEGRIERPFSSSPRFMILRPPEELLNGSHSACFREKGKDVYEVHWTSPPKTVDAGILGIEQIIAEELG